MRPETDGLDDKETEIATPIERPSWRIETGKKDVSEINGKSCAEGLCGNESITEGKSIEHLDGSYQMPRTEVTRYVITSFYMKATVLYIFPCRPIARNHKVGDVREVETLACL